ncbi:hypothetical protein L6164_026812 [Bauhinia variegata]|uniref:Uncharacterized protein n=1 Tax=Bauhinia variegata TaxID=167791 RepID=A0ACB9LSS1_BAUVA|nr:hypothetical protein L6164_026812 [Bauhinia variegata]
MAFKVTRRANGCNGERSICMKKERDQCSFLATYRKHSTILKSMSMKEERTTKVEELSMAKTESQDTNLTTKTKNKNKSSSGSGHRVRNFLKTLLFCGTKS